MKTLLWTAIGILGLAGIAAAQAPTGGWIAGTHYFVLKPAQPTSVGPGKIEVVEIFSYACPACNQFRPYANSIKAALPKNAVLTFVPASFRKDEDWPMFQRAFYAADALGVVERTHEAMYDAVWKSKELSTLDGNRPKNPLPSIEDAAKFYEKVAGVKAATFLATANSFGVDANMDRADAYLKACKVDSTPTFIVNGKYRVDSVSAGGSQKVVDIVKFLVAKESGPAR